MGMTPESTRIRQGVRDLIASLLPGVTILESANELDAFELESLDVAVGLYFKGWELSKDQLSGERAMDPRVYSMTIVLGVRKFRKWTESIEALEAMEKSLDAVRTQKVCRIADCDVYLKLTGRTTDTPSDYASERGGPVRFVINAETEVIYL